ncbi:hypothetical protein A2661_00765 [Candidatus Giovannonibacteria bacterium RIFCSPHIGHO2_01_FULL_45_24]|uniref:Uncharacterized protein n=1 Tax=Candidatus Giovannonibacteria bacterium RIFCSPLOWO2_01_FULL_46_32 TaxID=1798353 RepID=A0A1F5XGR6_9BACT|nr:MAG: hypothetical protein A2661_00765 [Candidatus Giovannonibacteria bacterium RIFCSPHIGHO2_01_FULL_45_24]OGF87108.1 MAG: hypothetical protein A3B19_01605 [Candidatus Giovannonibacteria bacterium RIFCSPLOWO2_01_FULL_46_32]
MNNDIAKKILKRLDGIETRIAKLERGDSDATIAEAATGKKRKKSKRVKTDLGTPVKKLIESGFFRDWKTDNDVVKKLKQQVLTAKRASISNVLRRFASPAHGLLQRDGEGTKKHPWRYKQKN